jgi:hypothetical protein
MYPKLKINVHFIFLNIGDLTFGITLVYLFLDVDLALGPFHLVKWVMLPTFQRYLLSPFSGLK